MSGRRHPGPDYAGLREGGGGLKLHTSAMDSHTFAPRRVHFATSLFAALSSALALALIVGPSQAVGKVLVIPALIASVVAIGRSFHNDTSSASDI